MSCELSVIVSTVAVVRRGKGLTRLRDDGRPRVISMRFYPRVWFSTQELRDLSFELRAALLELHALAAPGRRLPNDYKRLARRLGINPRPMQRYLAGLRGFYTEVDEVVIELHPLEALDPKGD